MIGFILPNEGSDRLLEDFAVTVDVVEKATGLDFFSTLPQAVQKRLEAQLLCQRGNWIKKCKFHSSPGAFSVLWQPSRSIQSADTPDQNNLFRPAYPDRECRVLPSHRPGIVQGRKNSRYIDYT